MIGLVINIEGILVILKYFAYLEWKTCGEVPLYLTWMKNPWWSSSSLNLNAGRLRFFSIKFHHPIEIIVGSIVNFPINSLWARNY